MPCKDSTSAMVIELASDETLRHFSFHKITCQKPVGGETGYESYCRGLSVEAILKHDFSKLLCDLHVLEMDSQFFLYMEWWALRSALTLYRGEPMCGEDQQRCVLVSLDVAENVVRLKVNIRPPQDMPKIVSCHSADKKVAV